MSKGKEIEKLELYKIISSVEYQNCGKCNPCNNVEILISRLSDYINGKLTLENIKYFAANSFDIPFYDEINSIISNVTDIPSDFNLINLDKNKKKVYFDQNIFSDSLKHDDFLNNIISSKKHFQYIYSPEHLEEVYKIESEQKRDEFIDIIKDITDSTVLLPNIDKYHYAIEDPIYSLKRIIAYDGSTQLVEEHKLMISKDRSIFRPKYDTDLHKKTIGNNKNILKNIEKEEFSDLMRVCGSPFQSIDEFEDLISNADLVGAIRALYDCLDLLSYKIDKNDRTIKSGIHDIEHLIYASHMDYFVTKDKKLRDRATEIFSVMKKNVVILSKESYIELTNQA